ncbi:MULTISPECIES: formate/nitrite transporter family protein [Methylobacterium]|uniref:Inner membrane protein YfdC n=1 Tax=Methylobacterium thuringiense TaxID=1003091 RepID=A0ABQ4TMW1_9HYPH|nr:MULTISPECIES: formate/nitrite transporter family protein [Methylobacterium]TXN21875.1 formate/nitrite transporter family protein [Methylobacterium sp. WL9]GJE55380.1 Inner membrane protein YfdC [Methylobacterium thuringiense]
MTEESRAEAAEKQRDTEEEVEEKHRPDALLLHEIIRAEGEEELRRTVTALALSAFAAGLTMGFSLIVPGVLKAHLPESPWAELVSSFGYSIGFLIVVLGRQQLFTENTVTPILPLLHERTLANLWRVGRLWGIVLVGNVAATLLIAYALGHSDAFKPEVRAAFTELSRHAVEGPFLTTLVKAVFAGWLIALMVWILPATGSAAPFIIILMTWLVSMCGLAHIVAGSVDAFYLVVTGSIGMGDYVWHFFVPTLVGNVIGGVALVSVLNYGQVAPEVAENDAAAGKRQRST